MPLAVAGSLGTLAAAALAALLLAPDGARAQGEQDQYQDAEAGKDPQAFTDIVGLYGPSRAEGCEAATQAVTAALQAGERPESERVAALLQTLGPCAARERTQEAMDRWVELAASLVRAQGGTAAPPGGLAQANQAYRRGDFKGAALAYRRVLASAPMHLDARNNLGLAELHAGNDAAAQVHLELLRRLEPSYVPGLANLTVVAERLGQRARAERAAREALRAQKDYPPAVYNAAWMANAAGDYDSAAELLAPILLVKSNPVHQQLNALNEKQRAREASAVLLVERFDDAARGWETVANGQYYDAVLENGSYVVSTKNDNCSLLTIPAPLEAPPSLDVELRSLWKSGVKNKAYTLLLGRDRDHCYRFGLSANGMSAVLDWDKSSPDPRGWLDHAVVAAEGAAPNRQTVQVRGSRLVYLVNGHPFLAFDSHYPLSGRSWVVGVEVCGQQKVAFDELRFVKR